MNENIKNKVVYFHKNPITDEIFYFGVSETVDAHYKSVAKSYMHRMLSGYKKNHTSFSIV